MDYLRWGVLGASKFALEQLTPAIQLARNNSFKALASSSKKRATAFAQLEPEIELFGDYNELLEDGRIDAVYIPLPNTMHVDWTIRAIKSGKHVLCEKPIAMKAGEINELINLRNDTGLLVAEAYMIVHHPQWQKAKEIVESGVLGELTQVDSVFSYNNKADLENIRNNSEMGGGGLPDIGVYTLGSVRFVTGQEPLALKYADIKYENGVDVWALAAFDFPKFKFTSITSMRMAPRQEVTFHGTDGFIKLTAPFNPLVYDQAKIIQRMNDGTEKVFIYPGVSHYVNQIEAFSDTVLKNKTYPCSLEFSQGTQAMIDSILDFVPG
jgi:predicted dehydrogenase